MSSVPLKLFSVFVVLTTINYQPPMRTNLPSGTLLSFTQTNALLLVILLLHLKQNEVMKWFDKLVMGWEGNEIKEGEQMYRCVYVCMCV